MSCPANATFSTTYQGVQICSNVDPNEPQASGTHYTYRLMFNSPISVIFGGSYTIADMQNEIITQLEAQGHATYNWGISYPSNTTIQLDFNASSPPLLLIAIIIVGIAVISAFLYLIVATTGAAGKIFLGGLGIALGVGVVGALLYKLGVFGGNKKQ